MCLSLNYEEERLEKVERLCGRALFLDAKRAVCVSTRDCPGLWEENSMHFTGVELYKQTKYNVVRTNSLE